MRLGDNTKIVVPAQMAGRNYSGHKFSQVLRKDGSLDVDKLARECSRDVFEDKRHRRVDDMKKKAIGTSRDYDEFRNFVHCAEDMLEPVSSREMEELKRGRMGWAHTAAARATRRDRTTGGASARFEPRRRVVLEDTHDAATRPPPSTPLELDRDWRRCRTRPGPKRTAAAALAETRRRRETYLARHGPTVLAPLLASELDATLVAEVLDTVCRPWVEAAPTAALPPPPPTGEGVAVPPSPPPAAEGASPARRAQDALHWLEVVARAPRFSLNLLMFEKELTDTIGGAIENAGAAAEGPEAEALVAAVRASYGAPP